VVLLTIPWVREAFNFGPLEPTQWVVAVVAGCSGVAWFEAYKRTVRRSR